MRTFKEIQQRLRLPLVAAPMFRVSGLELVVAAAKAGVVAAFPTANTRTSNELGLWLTHISEVLTPTDAPVAANLIVHHSNARLREDLKVLLEQPPEIVITSVGSPARVVEPLHDVGTLVFSDIASIRHAHRAVESGADGLILLTAGAGGQTGWANPFAFVRAVRAFYDGPVVVAGGMGDGVALRAAITLGADLAYMGTAFLATSESMAPDEHKQMVAACNLDDVLLTSAFTGLPTSMLKPSITAAGINVYGLHAGRADVGSLLAQAGGTNAWRDLCSAGHSTSSVTGILTVADLVERTAKQYRQ